MSSWLESVHLPSASIGRLGSSFLAASMYFLASAGSPLGLAMKSRDGPLAPPASSKPGKSMGRKCVARSPAAVPPRVSCSALRSEAATTALRTLRLSNGLIVEFIETKR